MRVLTFSKLMGLLSLRKRAYQMAFGPAVLDNEAWVDLAKYCGFFEVKEISAHRDLALIMHGRREAFVRIFAHLHLEPHELANFFRAVVAPVPGDDE